MYICCKCQLNLRFALKRLCQLITMQVPLTQSRILIGKSNANGFSSPGYQVEYFYATTRFSHPAVVRFMTIVRIQVCVFCFQLIQRSLCGCFQSHSLLSPPFSSSFFSRYKKRTLLCLPSYKGLSYVSSCYGDSDRKCCSLMGMKAKAKDIVYFFIFPCNAFVPLLHVCGSCVYCVSGSIEVLLCH